MKVYKLQIVFDDQLLATAPANPEVYAQFIASRAREEADVSDEAASLPTAAEKEKTGWSVFHEDEHGLLIFDYTVRGFLKEAATAITGKVVSAVKSKLDKWLFVFPRKLYLMRDGQHIAKADGVFERPLRAMTAQGPRVSVKRSDYVERATIEAELRVLDLGRDLTEDLIRSWLDYGVYQGMGEFRNGSFGRFTYTLSAGDAASS